MAFYEIPLTPGQQRSVTVTLGGGIYTLTTHFSGAEDGGWTVDIADAQGKALACGLACVTGVDLLGQLQYLGVPGRLWVMSDGDLAAVPGFADLGTTGTSHLLFEPF